MSPPPASRTESVQVPIVAISATVEAVLSALVQVLKCRPDLVAAVRQVVAASTPAAASLAPPFLSVARYANYRAVSERTIRYDMVEMVEGKHFHRVGRKGRRVVIHVHEADSWYTQRAGKGVAATSIEALALDEVTRRRARVALSGRKEK